MEVFSTKKTCPRGGSGQLSCRSSLNVSIATMPTISGWPAAYHHAYDICQRQRAAMTWGQALAVLWWIKNITDVQALALDAGVSQVAAYRYHLRGFRVRGGILVRTDRVAVGSKASNHLWHSGNHKALGGNISVLTNYIGLPLRTAPVEPGLTYFHHRHTCLYSVGPVPVGLPMLADKGYTKASNRLKFTAKNPSPKPRYLIAQLANNLHVRPG